MQGVERGRSHWLLRRRFHGRGYVSWLGWVNVYLLARTPWRLAWEQDLTTGEFIRLAFIDADVVEGKR